MRYLGMEVDRAIGVAEQIDISVADAIASAADMVGAGDFAADPELPDTDFVDRRWAGAGELQAPSTLAVI